MLPRPSSYAGCQWNLPRRKPTCSLAPGFSQRLLANQIQVQSAARTGKLSSLVKMCRSFVPAAGGNSLCPPCDLGRKLPGSRPLAPGANGATGITGSPCDPPLGHAQDICASETVITATPPLSGRQRAARPIPHGVPLIRCWPRSPRQMPDSSHDLRKAPEQGAKHCTNGRPAVCLREFSWRGRMGRNDRRTRECAPLQSRSAETPPLV